MSVFSKISQLQQDIIFCHLFVTIIMYYEPQCCYDLLRSCYFHPESGYPEHISLLNLQANILFSIP